MAQTIKMIFPPPDGSALHNKIVANERDRKEFEGGYLRVERFLQIYKDEIKTKGLSIWYKPIQTWRISRTKEQEHQKNRYSNLG